MLILTYKFIVLGKIDCIYRIFIVILQPRNHNKLLSLWNIILKLRQYMINIYIV